jgi:hypothetical protein
VKGLIPGTVYYCRVVASSDNNTGGRTEASSVSFTAPLPNNPMFMLRTLPARIVTEKSAILRGTLDYIWGYSSLQCWFEWGSTSQYGNRTPARMISNPGPIEAEISGLIPGANYHYRVGAVGPAGLEQHGADQLLKTTQGKILSVSTGEATNLLKDTVTLNGQVSSLGSSQAVRVYFEWGQDKTYGKRITDQIITSPQNVSGRIEGLLPGTTYHYRLVAVALGDAQAIAIGDDHTLTTLNSTNQPGPFGCQGPR